MTDLKTKKNDKNVDEFVDSIENATKREDCRVIMAMMSEVTKSSPAMWGDNIIGFGDYRYKYSTGREGDWFQLGLSPRKQNISLYISWGFDELEEYLDKLGKHKKGVGCLYINKLADIDMPTLREILEITVKKLNKP